MTVIKLQEPPNHPVYEISEFHRLSEVTDWLEKLEEEDVSVSIRNNLYHFRTKLERQSFIVGIDLGHQATWDFLCGAR